MAGSGAVCLANWTLRTMGREGCEKRAMSIAIQCERCHSQFRVNFSLAGQVVHCLNCGFAIHVPVVREAGIAGVPPAPIPQVPTRSQPARRVEPAPPRVAPPDAPPVPRQVIGDMLTGGDARPAVSMGAPPPVPRQRSGIGAGAAVIPPQLQGPDIQFVPEEVDRFAEPAADPQSSAAGASGSGSATRLLSGTRDPGATRAMEGASSDSSIAELPPLEGLLPSGDIPQFAMRQEWPFGPGRWKTHDSVAANFVIWGAILCLAPLLAGQWAAMAALAPAFLYTGLTLAFTGSAIFSINQRFGLGATTGALVFLLFLGGASRYSLSPDSWANRLAQREVPAPTTQPVAPVERITPSAPAPVVVDPFEAQLARLNHEESGERLKAQQWLINSATPSRFEQISRASEPRLRDADGAVALAALRGVDLHRDERSLKMIMATLRDPRSPEFKAAVHQILLERKDPLALEMIVPRLADEYEQVRPIIDAIATSNAPNRAKVTEYLEASVSSPNARQRELAIDALASYPGARTGRVIVPLLNDRQASVRHAAMRTLGKLKEPGAVNALVARLREDQEAASAALEAIGAPAESALVALLREHDKALRQTAAKLLRTVATRDSLEAIKAAAADPDHAIAAPAMEAWKRIDPQSVTAAAISAFELESPDPARWGAALERLGKTKVEIEHRARIAAKLTALALHEEKSLRSRAVALLPAWADEGVVPALIKLIDLRTEDQKRKRAILALGAMRDPSGAAAVAKYVGNDTAEVLEALRAMGGLAQDQVIALLENPDANIRLRAVGILRDNADVQAIPALQKLAAAEPALKAECQAAIAAIRQRLAR